MDEYANEYRFDAVADALNELALLAHGGHEVAGRLARVERGGELPSGAVERASEPLTLRRVHSTVLYCTLLYRMLRINQPYTVLEYVSVDT